MSSNNSDRRFVDWRDKANTAIIALATRATVKQYMADRTGSVRKISMNRGFSELTEQIGWFMGFGRCKATIGDVINIEFERGGLNMTAEASRPLDKAVDMAYLRWVEAFMAMIGMERREFEEAKSFMYRGFTMEQLAEIRSRGRTACAEHVAMAEQEQRDEAKRAEEQEARARREKAELEAYKDEVLQISRLQRETNDQRDRATRELEQLRQTNDQARRKIEKLVEEARDTRKNQLVEVRKLRGEIAGLERQLNEQQEAKLKLEQEIAAIKLEKLKLESNEHDETKLGEEDELIKRDEEDEKTERDEKEDEGTKLDEHEDEEAKRDEREDQDPPENPTSSA